MGRLRGLGWGLSSELCMNICDICVHYRSFVRVGTSYSTFVFVLLPLARGLVVVNCIR
jgi:hypothetical protein